MSLWDMIQFYQERFFEGLSLLRQIESELGFKESESSSEVAYIQRLKFALGLITEQCGITELREPGELAASINRGLRINSQFYDLPSIDVILAQLKLLRESIQRELCHRLFIYVPLAKAEYWRLSGPFPRRFLPQDIKAAQWEIDEAGNCYAAGRSTACVFHLMRAAEHGLRMLARKLRVKISDKGKMVPIEFGDWNKVIIGIKNKISDVRKLPLGPKRQAKLEAYDSAADHCEYMKEIWRNNLAHAREPYEDPEAVKALRRVSDFMQFLGKELSAGLKT